MYIKINGEDWSKDINPYSIEPYHEKVQGPNSGVSMGGTTIFDTVKIRECFSAQIGLLTQERYIALSSLVKFDYVSVVYTDPNTNKEVTRNMSITAGKARQIPLLGGGFVYKNITLDFREI